MANSGGQYVIVDGKKIPRAEYEKAKSKPVKKSSEDSK